MKIKVDDSKVVFFVVLILQVKDLELQKKIQNITQIGIAQKREIYMMICKNSKNELEAYNETKLEAQKKFHIINVESQLAARLTPKIFL